MGSFQNNQGRNKTPHTFDINTQIPVFIHITEANVHDVNAMDIINYERFAYYIFDRVMWIIPYYIKSQSLMLILLLVQNQM